SSRRRHTRFSRDWSSDVCSSDLRTLHIPVATGFHTRFDSYFSHYGLPFLAPLAFAWLRRFHNHGGMTLVPTAQLRDFLSGQGFRSEERRVGKRVDLAVRTRRPKY